MLTDENLRCLGDKMNIKIEGIYFKDELPHKLKYNTSYIINLHNSENDGVENEGSHWCCFQINEYKNSLKQGVYFDSYGKSMPKNISDIIFKNIGERIPYAQRNIQSLMAECCGYFVLAFIYHIQNSKFLRTSNIHEDSNIFLAMFDDLDVSMDMKKNEYILKHFFRSNDKLHRMKNPINIDNIVHKEDKRKDLMKIPIYTTMKK